MKCSIAFFILLTENCTRDILESKKYHDSGILVVSVLALKGTPNTTVRIVIERLIGGEHDTLTLTRERVAIPSVPYAGFVARCV